MRRYNIFNQLHKGLRALLYDTAMMIQQTAFCNTAEGMVTLDKLNAMLRLFDEHARLEDVSLLPALKPFDTAAIGSLEAGHQVYRSIVLRLRGLMQIYEYAVTANDKAEAGKVIADAFREFLIGALQHMTHEESVLNRILWHHFTDTEIFAIEQQILSLIPDDELAIYTQWMVRGMNNYEIIEWLKAVEKKAPAPVLQTLFALAEKELSAIRWQKVQEGLIEGAMVA